MCTCPVLLFFCACLALVFIISQWPAEGFSGALLDLICREASEVFKSSRVCVAGAHVKCVHAKARSQLANIIVQNVDTDTLSQMVNLNI